MIDLNGNAIDIHRKTVLLVLSRRHINMSIAQPLTLAFDQRGFDVIILWVHRTADVPVEMFDISRLTSADKEQILSIIEKFDVEDKAARKLAAEQEERIQ